VALCEEISTDNKHESCIAEDLSAEGLSKKLLTIGNGCVPVDQSSGLIFPRTFCNLVSSKDELINKVFPNIIHNHKNQKLLSERAILTAKIKDVDDLKLCNSESNCWYSAFIQIY
jgi:PIF1 helicase.